MNRLAIGTLPLAMLAVWLAGAAAPAGTSRVAEEAARAARGESPASEEPAGPTPSKKPIIPIAWRGDLEAAKREAARLGRCIMIFFRADWCGPCRLMFLDPAGEPLHMVLGPRVPEDFYRILEQVRQIPALMERQHAHPDSLEANFALGNALAKLNHLKRAAPYLEKAARLDPDNAHGRRSQARLILAVVPLEDGDADRALANIEAYLKEFPDAPEAPVAVWFQGTILYRDGRLREARRYFESLIRRFPKHPKAYQADKAIEHIDRLLEAKTAGARSTPAAKRPSAAEAEEARSAAGPTEKDAAKTGADAAPTGKPKG